MLSLLFAVAFGGVDEAWRNKHKWPNRYEGAAEEKVAAGSVVEMIGFHAYLQDFQSNDNVKLSVRFYAPEATTKARVQARERERGVFYWMEAKQRQWPKGWNCFAPWPVGDVLKPLQIGSDKLLVFVRLDGFSLGSGAVAPAFVTTTDSPIAVREYHVYFLAGKNLTSVRYTLRSEKGVVLSGDSPMEKQSHDRFMISIPAAGLAPGPMRLELKCRVAGEPGPAANYAWTFVHQPQTPGGG